MIGSMLDLTNILAGVAGGRLASAFPLFARSSSRAASSRVVSVRTLPAGPTSVWSFEEVAALIGRGPGSVSYFRPVPEGVVAEYWGTWSVRDGVLETAFHSAIHYNGETYVSGFVPVEISRVVQKSWGSWLATTHGASRSYAQASGLGWVDFAESHVGSGATRNLEIAIARGYTPLHESLDEIYSQIERVPLGAHTDFSLSKTMLEKPP